MLRIHYVYSITAGTAVYSYSDSFGCLPYEAHYEAKTSPDQPDYAD